MQQKVIEKCFFSIVQIDINNESLLPLRNSITFPEC